MVVVTAALLVLGLPPVACACYLAFLAICSRRHSAPTGDADTRFDVIVPAHDESALIAGTVQGLLALDYPRERFRVLVVADNCRDDTAARAGFAGASVLVRDEPEKRGKGYALAHGYRASLADGFADAVVVVDADSSVSSNLLRSFSMCFGAGAEAVQAEYAVSNPESSWRTRLMVVAFSLFHTLRSLGRERLRLSCGLRGNGMGFTAALLRRVPPRAFSIVEDVEYGIALGLSGTRVVYVAEAIVRGEMPASSAASRSQRERWERGRWSTAVTHVPTLLRSWLHGGGRVPFDLALDLLVPPLTTLVAVCMAGVIVSLGAYRLGSASIVAPAFWGLSLLALAVYVVRGVVLTGLGLRVLKDLLWAPVYALWKISLVVRRRPPSDVWVRTARADEQQQETIASRTRKHA